MPGWFSSLFETGAVALVAVAILIVETGVLLRMRHRLGLSGAPLVFNALSGVALLMALWIALAAPQDTLWIAVCLATGLVGHLGDIITRIRQKAILSPSPGSGARRSG